MVVVLYYFKLEIYPAIIQNMPVVKMQLISHPFGSLCLCVCGGGGGGGGGGRTDGLLKI